MVWINWKVFYLLFEPTSDRTSGAGLWTCLLSVPCTGIWGQEQLQKFRGDSHPHFPFGGRTLQPGSILVLIHVPLLAPGSCIGRMAGMQVSCEGFREGQPSLGSAAVSIKFAGQG